MTYFKVKTAVLLTGALFLSGCSFSGVSLNNSASKVREKALNKTQEIVTKEVSVLFVGDLMFDRYIREIAVKRGSDFIFEKISSFLKESDFIVANLEGPITDNKSVSVGTIPGEKGHLSFTFDKSLAETLYKQNIKLVNLGNNHILNFGNSGLLQTENYLKESNIDYFGDPENNEKNYIIKEINGIKIGFVSYNQFGKSAEGTVDDIKNIRGKVDIIAIYGHWGKEYEKNPSDNIKNLAHSFIDAGADLIIGSHPHVIQSAEDYKGKKIYYSLGNFIFDQYFSTETQKGLAVRVKINPDNKNLEFQETALFMDKNGQTKCY
ncbi:MAG: CapA family protein [Parcubacteria group bacterium]|jgi:poly-gamma-glutamate synthesis protein (capsule biosynthesis protein)